ncbi:MAG: hypothetical protein IKL66_00695 [Clostridia bacterium]|nr:hypothetical protein [Clostridia bacterium]
MKKQGVFGLVAGITMGVAAAVAGGLAAAKVVKEIRSDLDQTDFVSPNGDNVVTIKYGASDFANGLTLVKIQAYTENSDDSCDFALLAGKNSGAFSCEWEDNEHFELLVGSRKRKQCCEVDFEGEEIVISYYLNKEVDEAPVQECDEVVEETAEE